MAIVGASDKPDRYSNKAQVALVWAGHCVLPISPRGQAILDAPGFRSMSEIDGEIDTVTLYVRPERLEATLEDIIQKRPRRVIFNPGTESAESIQRFRDAGIHTIEACTLVLLATGDFETA